MLIQRRSLLLGGALAAAAPRAAWAQSLSQGLFTNGVASGDPLPDGVVLWTRFVGGDGAIAWEVAEDEAFGRVAQRGEARASAANDFCVKVDVRGLAPGRPYFYRFLSASGPSFTGRTRTAPARGGDRLTVALFSCSNFGYGYFHAYGHAARRDDVDLALHTGDYIYEIQRGSYPNNSETVPGRIIEPYNEIVSLRDYCQRYASYHTDPDLLELRRVKPMSVVWDDHELVNDAAREGSRDHQFPSEGAYAERMAAAAKAYFDWMPIRRPDVNTPRLYRSLDWGDLARIVLLDTRFIGRDAQIDYRTTLAPRLTQGGVDARAAAAAFRAGVLDDPSRSLLGAAQERWLSDTLAESKRRGQPWQIIAQQVVVADPAAPSGLARLLPDDVSAGSRQWFTVGEQMSALGLPWNLDTWGGYPAARTRFLEACATQASNAVVLGGDSHNCWVANLDAAGGRRRAALEFAGGSVTSPGFERSLSNAAAGERESMIRTANPHLAFCDLTNRGYAALRFTRGECEAEWLAFADVRTPVAPAPQVSRLHAAAGRSAGPGAWIAA
ncbi:MAG TPA: alkaline phosphatase D family protein [Vitreimonas sp.]|uniref:alkaline phosphatase D family protein n=1 Tax=Vitreimonas sp. TaxID=3069702 RepID=UPI002D4C38DF|nr:alkaline phosphatase D family protein [Vitreimonas sp.]HYD87388.1 alkaline phosphatase D family protein [Vitreimonas sp.]